MGVVKTTYYTLYRVHTIFFIWEKSNILLNPLNHELPNHKAHKVLISQIIITITIQHI